NSRWGLRENERVKLMEAVLMPRVSYGALVWATIQNKSKTLRLAEKTDNLAAICTLGTFKSTPLSWHKTRSVVKGAFSVIQSGVVGFYCRKLTRIRAFNRIQDNLAYRGFDKPSWLGKHLPEVQGTLDQLK
ncbi:uncharacterized protein VP01_13373g1, partial [Puccinia sorghi]